MRIGVMVGGSSRRLGLGDLTTRARDLESRGFATLWIPNVLGLDAVTASAVIGRETDRIEIGTAIVPTYPRHPAALAQQALTAAVACRGRFTLGIGLSHPPVIEGMLGLSYARRARHMREYMEVLGPLLRGEKAEFAGEEYRVNLALDVPGAPPVPVLIAALGDHQVDGASALAFHRRVEIPVRSEAQRQSVVDERRRQIVNERRLAHVLETVARQLEPVAEGG